MGLPFAYNGIAAISQQRRNTPRPKLLTVGATFSNTANRGTKIIISKAGNLIGFFSPNQGGAEYEHLDSGARSEGYVLCYNASNVWDTGSSVSGFRTPSISGISTTGATVTRRTTDNLIELKQVFSFAKEGQGIGIEMTVTNRSAGQVSNVILRRQVDFDIDTGGAQGWANFANRFARTSVDGVFAWQDAVDAPAGREAHGVLLRAEKISSVVLPKVTSSILDTSCNPASQATPTGPVDSGATLQFNLGNLNPTTSKTVNVRYLRF
ncbi:MAG TPA: hypothetical protein V6D19_02025 [Stenomitos sp.]